MQFLATLIFLASAGAVEIGLAPDQPLPFVYTDDPLIIEIRTNEPCTATLHTVVTEAATKRRVEAEQANLNLQGTNWFTIKDLPEEQGYYTIQIEVKTPTTTTNINTGFCRIPRPSIKTQQNGDANSLFAAHQEAPDKRILLALQGMGITNLELGEAARAASLCHDALHLGFHVAASGNTSNSDPECANAMSMQVLHGSPTDIINASENLRDSNVSVPFYAFVPSAEVGSILFEEDTARRITGMQVPLDGILDSLPVLRDTAETHGHEAWKIIAYQEAPPRLDDESAIRLLRDGLDALAAGASGLVFDDAWIYNNNSVGPWLLYCGALSKRMTAQRFAGRLDLGNGVHAPLFRDGARWFLALWTDSAEQQISLPLLETSELQWTDALNNPLNAPTVESPKVVVSPRPRYLTGSGGTLLADAARDKAVTLAKEFAANARFERYVPVALHGLASAISEEPEPANARNRFFQLIRYLPELERQWHAGELPRTIALPAIAHVARLARPLCVLEEASGNPFLEPLSDTLMNCQEYQSLYLTGSVATSLASERGDWLMREVQRLTEEARLLDNAGRHIEASAVATLAEWRARALVYAAKAGPLSDAAQELPLSELPIETSPGETPPEGDTEVSGTDEPTATPSESSSTGDETRGEDENTDNTDAHEPEIGSITSDNVDEPAIEPEEALVPAAIPLEPGQPFGTKKVIHSVSRGENPDVIARKYGVPRNDLLKWNDLSSSSIINIGQELVLYVADTGEPETPPLEEGQPSGTIKKIHTVKSGEFPGAIARKYGVAVNDLLEWNNLTSRSVINIGQELVVYVPENQE